MHVLVLTIEQKTYYTQEQYQDLESYLRENCPASSLTSVRWRTGMTPGCTSWDTGTAATATATVKRSRYVWNKENSVVATRR